MADLFTYNPFVGLRAGIPMTIGAPLPQNPSRVAPPHLRVDSAGFIGVNTRWQHPQFVSGRLLRSSLTTIEPQNGRPFKVFDTPRPEDDFTSLIFIDTSVPKGVTRREGTDVNAWTGIRGEGFAPIMVDTTTGSALLRCEPNATIELFQFDGSVHQLLVRNGKVSTAPLSQKQMAVLRIEQFEEQIISFDLSLERDVRRLHGILGGALRLVSAVKDRDALDALVDFFVDHQAQLTDNLRTQVRWALLNAGHQLAGTFLDGFEAVNVVRMSSSEPTARLAARSRKSNRSERDRQIRSDMRGGHGGGKKQQSAGGKGKK